MNERLSKVANIAAELVGDDSFGEQVQDLIDKTTIIKTLIGFRLKRELTQKQIAEKIGVTPSYVSKLESGLDEDMKLSEIIKYCEACAIGVAMSFDDEQIPIGRRIKLLVYQIHELLNDLVDLAKREQEDKELCLAIHRFTGEVLMNFLARYKGIDSELANVVKLHIPAKASPKEHINELEPSSVRV